MLHTLNHNGDVVTLGLAPDKQTLATGGEDSIVWLWDLETGQKIFQTPLEADGAIQALTFSPISETHLLVTGSADAAVLFWNWENGEKIAPLGRYTSVVNRVFF